MPAKNAAGKPTPLPLRDPTSESSTSWRYVVALPTSDSRRTRTTARTPTENRIEQLRTALTRLRHRGRVELARDTGRGRFERFRLLNESIVDPDELVYYTLPRANELVVRVPVEFFFNGWVHALTDSEIAAYLYLLLLQQQNSPDPEIGMPVSRDVWGSAFDLDRAHIGYRMLTRFGLVRILRQDVRRDDGTIEGYKDGDFEYTPSESLRFFVDLEALQVDALSQVLPALELAATSTRLDEAYAASQGIDL